MNINLLNIIKRIVSEKGESILSDAQKLNPLFKDYAKDEPKDERAAFGRCIEIGSYQELKNTTTENERKRKKTTLVSQLHAKTGIDKKLCVDALDILEAVIFKTSNISSVQTNYSPEMQIGKEKKISKRTIAFGIAGALGGGIGSLIGGELVREIGGTFLSNIMHWAIWTVMVAIGISIGLLITQFIYQKKKLDIGSILKTVLIAIVISTIAGGIAGVIVSFGGGNHVSRVIGWGIIGLGIGLGTTIFIPNFPKKRAVIAGLIGGVVGYIVSVVLSVTGLFSHYAGVILGDVVLSLFIGLSVSIIEEALREAWITVIWGKNETRSISLGEKPIVFGSSSTADVYLSKENNPSVRATIQIENSKVVMYDKMNNQRKELQNGERVDFGKISFIVYTKKA